MTSTPSYDWIPAFRRLYDKALQTYRGGLRDPKNFFIPEETAWLASIGCTPMEMYDFAEDFPDIDWETALLITSARRDYFLHVQKGQPSGKTVAPADFPSKDTEAAGIPWLPRIILKAKAKLRGEMPASLMYCCGGDRRFFREFDIHPADFLRIVWADMDRDDNVIDYVKSRGEHK